MASTFAKRVRERREALGLSQSMVALIMATSGFSSWRQTTMAKVESGDRDVKLAEAIALTQIVADRVPLDDMVGRFDGEH